MRHTRFVSSRVLLTGLAAVAAGVTGACSDSNAPSTPVGVINFVNADSVAATATVALRRDGTGFMAGVQYATGASKSTVADTGTHAFTVAAGSDTTTLASASLKVKADSAYTLVFVKQTAGPALVLLPYIATAPSAGHAKLRIVSYAVAPVDVYVTDSATTLDAATADQTNLTTEQAGAYIDYSAARKRVRLTATGTKTVLVDQMISLDAGQVASLLFLNPASGSQTNKSLLLRDL